MNPSTTASRLGSVAVALAAALALVAFAIVPFLNPTWVAFEQGRTGVTALTGFAETDVRTATNAILSDLVAGPPNFDVELNGAPVLSEPERAHMRDVRDVFTDFFAAASIAVAFLAAAFWLSRRSGERWTRRHAWTAVRRGALGLAAAVTVAGVIALVAFDAAFEVFHRLFFASGTYLFDPRTSRLVQLFPDAFWSETSIAVGATVLVFALGTVWLAGRRLRALGPVPRIGRAPEAAPGSPAPARIATGDHGTAR